VRHSPKHLTDDADKGQYAGKGAKRVISVQKTLDENPEFAEAFSQTIPVSPKISALDPEELSELRRSPAAEDVDLRRELEKHRQRASPPDRHLEIEEAETNDDVRGSNVKRGTVPVTSDEEEEEEEKEVEEEEEEEEIVSAGTDDEVAVPPEDEKDDEATMMMSEEDDDSIDIRGDVVEDGEKEKKSTDVSDDGGSGEKKKKKKKKKEHKKSASEREEDETMEKMHLVEQIKENATMGLLPPQMPSFNMPSKLLKQMLRFQEEKASEIMTLGMMGSGLIALVGVLEVINGKFDPVGKVFGRGLKLEGARSKVEENIDAYRVPFVRMYRDMKKKGHSMELPPWAQVVVITGGILKDVHMNNLYKEMQDEAREDRRDPETRQRAQELLEKKRAIDEAIAIRRQKETADSIPYHVTTNETAPGNHPKSDAEMEAILTKEFAGFDRLPSLDSISARRKGVESSAAAASPPTGNVSPAAVAVAASQAVNMVHRPNADRAPQAASTSSPSVADSRISMTHPPMPEADDVGRDDRSQSEDGGTEDDSGEYEEDEAEVKTSSIIRVPSIEKKR
jgi:hypothetical protein